MEFIIPDAGIKLVAIKVIFPHKLICVCRFRLVLDGNASGILRTASAAHLFFQTCRILCRLHFHSPPPKLMPERRYGLLLFSAALLADRCRQAAFFAGCFPVILFPVCFCHRLPRMFRTVCYCHLTLCGYIICLHFDVCSAVLFARDISLAVHCDDFCV